MWVRGSWAGLLLAVGFTGLLHITVIATLVWPEWLSPTVVAGCGATLALLWFAALWETRGELRRLAAERATSEAAVEADQHDADGQSTPENTAGEQDRVDALFAAAQISYLQANWVETERQLLQLLRIDREDTEAHLLLATLWRRTGKTNEARRRLRQLARREAAEPWLFEIENELQACEAAPDASQPAAPEPAPAQSAPPPNPKETSIGPAAAPGRNAA